MEGRRERKERKTKGDTRQVLNVRLNKEILYHLHMTRFKDVPMYNL